MKKRKGSGTSEHRALAMHSAANADWGTSMLLRRFAQAVLAPASRGERPIDLDYSTSAYWQSWWPEGQAPRTYLDGRRGRDVLQEADRDAVCPSAQRGSGFLNPAGLNGGKMVQKGWQLFEHDHRTQKLGSGFWVGFSLEHFSSLQGLAPRTPLTVGADDFITTIVPRRRCRYLLHPEQCLAITRKKQARRDRKSPLWRAEQRKIERLTNRLTDEPVTGDAPSHASYLSILWSLDRGVRTRQMAIARNFLASQKHDPKSVLQVFEVIGTLEEGAV